MATLDAPLRSKLDSIGPTALVNISAKFDSDGLWLLGSASEPMALLICSSAHECADVRVLLVASSLDAVPFGVRVATPELMTRRCVAQWSTTRAALVDGAAFLVHATSIRYVLDVFGASVCTVDAKDGAWCVLVPAVWRPDALIDTLVW